jgi:hypothetical protein
MIATGNKRLALRTAPLVLLALTPKCLLCVAAYAGLGAVLGSGGPELCGAPAGSTGAWTFWLSAAGSALGILGFLASCRRQQSAPTGKSNHC